MVISLVDVKLNTLPHNEGAIGYNEGRQRGSNYGESVVTSIKATFQYTHARNTSGLIEKANLTPSNQLVRTTLAISVVDLGINTPLEAYSINADPSGVNW